MPSPPPGFADLLGDAEDWPVTGEVQEMYVPRFGEIRARKPMPRAAAALGMSANRKIDAKEQFSHFTRFIIDHLAKGEYERILDEMVTDTEGELPEDVMQRVARTIATYGTARPYAAVTTLALFTGHNWRTVRHKLTLAGVSNPMGLPSLHALLDVTEQIVVEALYRSGDEREGPPSKGEMKVANFYNSIYIPDVDDDEIELDETPFVPAGFEDPDEMEADFDAFAAFGR